MTLFSSVLPPVTLAFNNDQFTAFTSTNLTILKLGPIIATPQRSPMTSEIATGEAARDLFFGEWDHGAR